MLVPWAWECDTPLTNLWQSFLNGGSSTLSSRCHTDLVPLISSMGQEMKENAKAHIKHTSYLKRVVPLTTGRKTRTEMCILRYMSDSLARIIIFVSTHHYTLFYDPNYYFAAPENHASTSKFPRNHALYHSVSTCLFSGLMTPWGQWAAYTSMEIFYTKQRKLNQPRL